MKGRKMRDSTTTTADLQRTDDDGPLDLDQEAAASALFRRGHHASSTSASASASASASFSSSSSSTSSSNYHRNGSSLESQVRNWPHNWMGEEGKRGKGRRKNSVTYSVTHSLLGVAVWRLLLSDYACPSVICLSVCLTQSVGEGRETESFSSLPSFMKSARDRESLSQIMVEKISPSPLRPPCRVNLNG